MDLFVLVELDVEGPLEAVPLFAVLPFMLGVTFLGSSSTVSTGSSTGRDSESTMGGAGVMGRAVGSSTGSTSAGVGSTSEGISSTSSTDCSAGRVSESAMGEGTE